MLSREVKMNPEQLRYRIAFSHVPGIGRVKLSLLESYFGDLARAWHASSDQLRTAGLDAKAADSLTRVRDTLDLDVELEKLEKYSVKAVSLDDPAYPPRLKEIYDYPPLLYVRGDILPEDECAVAVVGTRRPTIYGKQAAEDMATNLAHSKITVVSGLAAGVDSVAHRAALQAGRRTIAVAACGLDLVYPGSHVALARQIMEQGALVSEFGLGTKPKAEHFPQRNRIISGMSLGVLVIEADERSGALITARKAVEHNRDVFAIPGSIYSPMSLGANRLIQDGAKLVLTAADILEELNLNMAVHQIEMKNVVATTDTETEVLAYLTKEARHVDELCHCSGLPAATITGTLALLELKGLAKHVGSMSYVLA